MDFIEYLKESDILDLKNEIIKRLGYKVLIKKLTGSMKDYYQLKKPKGEKITNVGPKEVHKDKEIVKIEKVLKDLGFNKFFHSNESIEFKK